MVHRKQFATPPKRVALFVTCMVDMLYPEVGLATAELLERHGIEIVFPVEQTCCGQPAFNAGFRDEARQLAHRFLNIFEPLVASGEVDAIVCPSGSCNTMVSHFYEALFEGPTDLAERRRSQRLAEVTFELTEFLVDVLGITDTGARMQGKITYHACCHLLRELNIDAQPRALLANVKEAELVELAGAEECCGFGGLFSVKNANISSAMGLRKTINLTQSGADVVAMCDVSCMTHINGLLSRQAQHCRGLHIAEVLISQVDVTPAQEPRQDGGAPLASDSAAQQAQQPKPAPRRWQDIR